ncbi:MAG: helix-turn-helix transcriptional regulator [Oscillospiraceae bacterium]|nr:helix-turn-helix transcriptional regulator [Oscillospiraceae bacterium]
MNEKGVSTYALINKYGVSSSTVNRLRHNKGITLQTVDDLCAILACKVEDIVVHIPNE